MYPTFHDLATSTRSDCSGAMRLSQAFYRQFPRRTAGLGTACSTLCYDVVVKRLPIEQGVKQGRLLVKHVLPAIWKPIHSLWNEVIGFLFLSLAIIFGVQAVRYIHAHDPGRLFFAGFCTLLMLWFGITSFLRARKISRS